VGRHHRPDTEFDGSDYPDERTPRTAFRQGLLTGVLVTWALVLAGIVVYLTLIR
jgi:hypothetical protein